MKVKKEILKWMDNNQHVEDYLDMIRCNAEDDLYSSVQNDEFSSLEEFKDFIGVMD